MLSRDSTMAFPGLTVRHIFPSSPLARNIPLSLWIVPCSVYMTRGSQFSSLTIKRQSFRLIHRPECVVITANSYVGDGMDIKTSSSMGLSVSKSNSIELNSSGIACVVDDPYPNRHIWHCEAAKAGANVYAAATRAALPQVCSVAF